MRASAAISRADSIRQTASIVRWVSDVLGPGGRLRPQALVLLPQLGRVRGPEVFRLDHPAQAPVGGVDANRTLFHVSNSTEE